MTSIDFSQWTDMQLEVGERVSAGSAHGPDLLAEIARRKKAGTWMKDGSPERVAALARSSRKRRKTRER